VTTAARAVPRFALAAPTRLKRWLVLLTLIAVVVGGLYHFWFRDSSLVRVNDVSVIGLSGPEAPKLRKALAEAAMQQTTLHVDVKKLHAAVSSAPEIQSIRATSDFPHGLRIDVTENRPVAALIIPGGTRIPIAANGTLMPDAKNASVPGINVKAMPGTIRPGGQQRLNEPGIQRFVDVAAAAPEALLARASMIGIRNGDGLVVLIDNGPRIIFGDGSRLDEKWAAAAGVLASPDSSGAAYVDVTLPERPVAGGLKPQPGTDSDVQAPAQTTTPQAPAPPSTTTPAPTQTTPPAAATQTPPTQPQTPAQTGTATQQPSTGAVGANPQP
jgi:cell division protein FtsQ